MSIALIIFIKNPIKGRVKTRLGKVIGEEEALQIYLELCRLTRNAVHDFPGAKYVFYSDEIIEEDAWSSIQFLKMQQHGSDLGDRMTNAFKTLFEYHDRIILIGSDCPYLQKHHLLQAIQELDKVDCVIGPAKDGGYYLLGINTMIPQLFIDKSWSTQHVLVETLMTIKELNHTVQLLETLEDIDTISDWERYLNA